MPGEPKQMNKIKQHEYAMSSPVFEKGYPSYEAVNRNDNEPTPNPELDKRVREAGL